MGRLKKSCRIASTLAWVAALVNGCASYTPEPLSPDDNARAIDRRTLDDQRLQKFIVLELGSDGKAEPPVRWDLATLHLRCDLLPS
jgi:hypothetical protein